MSKSIPKVPSIEADIVEADVNQPNFESRSPHAAANAAKNDENKYAWVYLINLIFYFIPLYFMPFEPLTFGLVLAALVPFVACYFWAYNSNSQKAIYPIMAMIVLACLVTPLSTGSLSFFSFCGFFIGFFYPLKRALLGFAAISLILLSLNIAVGFEHYMFTLYGMLIVFAVGVLGVVERKRHQIKRQQLQSRNEIHTLATMLERERIARDLHDIMGHSLSCIALKAELADKLVAANQLDLARQQLQELGLIARESLTQVRDTVSSYKHKGLDASLSPLLQSLRDKGIAARLEGDIPKLDPNTEGQLILILTEWVSNMLKHSQAQDCSIQFKQQGSELELVMADDAKASPITEGNGLRGIRERVSALGGSFNYTTQGHYRFCVRLPLTNPINQAQAGGAQQ
ncbi:sensor histidine kinase [Shewanella denitrificans]|jgi:two-component system, NarL family, sensor histidine kinase DesK|nr:sensor histidine kinase [Shewanella denitrificans]